MMFLRVEKFASIKLKIKQNYVSKILHFTIYYSKIYTKYYKFWTDRKLRSKSKF